MTRTDATVSGFLLSIAAATASGSAAAYTAPWYYGPLTPEIGQDVACNTSIVETRVAAYSAYTYSPPEQYPNIPLAQLPAVGEVFYAKLVVSHPGNPCFGSAVGLQLLLPAGVTTAVSADNAVFCFSRVPPGGTHPNDYVVYDMSNQAGYGCPQTFSQGSEGLAINAPYNGAGAWQMAAGFWLEFLIPLKSSVPQNGANQIYFRVNPDLGVVGYTNIALYVNSDTIFRSPMDDTGLTLDICGLAPNAVGC